MLNSSVQKSLGIVRYLTSSVQIFWECSGFGAVKRKAPWDFELFSALQRKSVVREA